MDSMQLLSIDEEGIRAVFTDRQGFSASVRISEADIRTLAAAVEELQRKKDQMDTIRLLAFAHRNACHSLAPLAPWAQNLMHSAWQLATGNYHDA